ncbi:MAG: hypothetical protein U0V02_07135 [Anaerolineales bacterium]
MNDKQPSDFILGIAGNLVASLIIALVNILIGRFIPNSPRELLDIASLVIPLIVIFVFLYRNKITKIRIEPKTWFLQIQRLITQTPQAGQVRHFFYDLVNGVRQSVIQLTKLMLQSKNWVRYLEKAIKPSAIIVTAISVFLIVSFGVSIRWLYEQRTERTILPVYSSYQQIYDFLAPQNDTP